MNRKIILVCAAGAFALACGSKSKTPPPAADAGCTEATSPTFCSDVSGQAGNCHSAGDNKVNLNGSVELHPVAAQVLAALHGGSYTVDVTKFKVHVLNPLLVLTGQTNCVEMGDSPASITAGATASTGTYGVKDIDGSVISLGVIANTVDTTGTIQTHQVGAGAYGSMQSVAAGSTVNAVGPAIILPDEFEGVLSKQFGKNPGDLWTAGFIFGMVLDASHNPVSGATVSVSTTGYSVLYPSAQFSTAPGTTTSANGTFVVMWTGTGSPPASPTNITSDKTGTGSQQAGVSAGSGYIVFLTP